MSKNCEKSIREAAYFLWENAGSPIGQDEYFWSLAVKQANGCSSKKAGSSCSKKVKTSSASAKKTVAKKASVSSKKI